LSDYEPKQPERFSDRFPVPADNVTDAPIVCLPLNLEWIEVITGALDFLTTASAWDYADQTELDFALKNAETLLAVFNQAVECVVPQTLTVDNVIVEHQLAQNTAGGSSVANAWTLLPFNTIVQDDTGFATLVGNRLFLPVGLWRIDVNHVIRSNAAMSCRIRQETYTGDVGANVNFPATTIVDMRHSTIRNAQFLNPALGFEYYLTSALATNGLGLPMNIAGEVERYGRMIATRYTLT